MSRAKFTWICPASPSGTYTYHPAEAALPERLSANTHGVSFSLLGEVVLDDAGAQGMIFVQGSRFGGHSLFVQDRRLHDVYNFIGLRPEQHYVSDVELRPGAQVVGVEFVKETVGEHRESHGTVTMRVGETVVAQRPLRTQTGHFGVGDDGSVDLEQQLRVALARD